MKTAGKILGIVGGSIGLVGSYFDYQKVILLSYSSPPSKVDPEILSFFGIKPDNSFQTGQSCLAILALIVGVMCVIGSVLGIIGGLTSRKRRLASSVMMTAGCILNAFSYFNIAVWIPLLLGGLLTLIPENSSDTYRQQQSMRTVAKTLGIAGGSITLLVAAYSYGLFAIQEYYFDGSPFPYAGDLALLAAMAGIIGIAGSVIVTRRRILSGLLMFIGALASLVGDNNAFPFVLLLLGGIFALIPENKPEQLKEENI